MVGCRVIVVVSLGTVPGVGSEFVGAVTRASTLRGPRSYDGVWPEPGGMTCGGPTRAEVYAGMSDHCLASTTPERR